MTIRPGKNLLLISAGMLLLSTLAFVWWQVIFLLIVIVLLAALLTERERRQLAAMLPTIHVRRSMPTVIGRDRNFEIGLTIENKGLLKLQVEVRDEHPAETIPRLVVYGVILSPNVKTSVTTRCRIPRRGRHSFGPTWLRLQGPYRLVEVQQSFETRAAIKVLPETFISRDELQKEIGAEMRLLDQQRRAQQVGAGTEFESLYPFRRGDDPRRIDWRATARRRSLVVRRFRIERHRDVMIIIDSGRLMGTRTNRGTKLDCAVDAGLNLARVALHSGDRCGVAAYDNRVRGFLPPVAGVTALRSIVQCVYDLNTQWHESDFIPMLAELRARQSKRTFVIVISDLSDAESSNRLSASLQQLQRQHLVLFAALRAPLLAEIVHEPVEAPRDAARKAVTFRLLRDRTRALHALRRRGVHVLDVEPQQLNATLINQFVELRLRNLL